MQNENVRPLFVGKKETKGNYLWPVLITFLLLSLRHHDQDIDKRLYLGLIVSEDYSMIMTIIVGYMVISK